MMTDDLMRQLARLRVECANLLARVNALETQLLDTCRDAPGPVCSHCGAPAEPMAYINSAMNQCHNCGRTGFWVLKGGIGDLDDG